MIKGLYRSASGMLPRIKEQEITANNLANASAPGFKRDMVFTKELSRAQAKLVPKKSDWETPMIDQVYTDYDQGSLDQTGNPLDVALEGAGFFVAESAEGNTVLTRAGSFMISPDGYLVDPNGNRLLGDSGPIGVGEGTVSIAENGQVQVDDAQIGTLQVVDVADKSSLVKIGDNAFEVPQGIDLPRAMNFLIKQGYLESSNVNVVKEMVDMIVSFRNFEADAQAVKAQDDSLDKLINNVGRVR
ncbi:putative Flagellar basal-body rod protein FlgG [Candidatus Zixiibacteriota bacterium]|nr:putative Flagellar basal-body rod protein FlgG [candidate division Zixibacteria bacterium]